METQGMADLTTASAKLLAAIAFYCPSSSDGDNLPALLVERLKTLSWGICSRPCMLRFWQRQRETMRFSSFPWAIRTGKNQ